MKYIKGDLLQAFENGEVNLIAHQENCVSKNYAGIAKLIHEKYPETIDTYRLFGEVNYHHTKHGIVANLYSQYYPGSSTTSTFKKDKYQLQDNFSNRLVALEECLWNIRMFYSDKKIGIPLIASGLAKQSTSKKYNDLDYFKEFIAPIVENCLNDCDITVYYL